MFAGLQGGERDLLVLVCGRRDDDRLDVLVVEDGLIVLDLRGAGRLAGAAAHGSAVNIADGGHLRLRQPGELIEELAPHVPKPMTPTFTRKPGL